MSNTAKLLIRILIILVLMIIGAWLSTNMTLPDLWENIVVFAVYLLIGVMLGSVANPRFTKNKNKGVYMIPILIFVVIGALHMLYGLLHVAAWPFGLGGYLLNFSALSWSIAGFFGSLAFR